MRSSLIANLKMLRAQYGLSQAKLAEKAGISVSFVGDIETGKKFPVPEKLEALARVLHVRPFQLFMDPRDLDDYLKYLESFDLYREVAEKVSSHLQQSLDDYLTHRPKP